MHPQEIESDAGQPGSGVGSPPEFKKPVGVIRMSWVSGVFRFGAHESILAGLSTARHVGFGLSGVVESPSTTTDPSLFLKCTRNGVLSAVTVEVGHEVGEVLGGALGCLEDGVNQVLRAGGRSHAPGL